MVQFTKTRGLTCLVAILLNVGSLAQKKKMQNVRANGQCCNEFWHSQIHKKEVLSRHLFLNEILCT